MFINSFSIKTTCSSTRARLGVLNTLHGMVETPVFLPVGSQATVKSLSPGELYSIGIEMILCNAYHLYLQPGVDIIEKAGGLHSFMNWSKPILTDSGGYQIFSLSSLRNIDDQGVKFRSHIDGSEHYITPEYAIWLQEKLGADIIMTLDVCLESDATEEKIAGAVKTTAQWAARCAAHHGDTGQHLFGIIQGGTYPSQRRISAEQVTKLDLPGYAIGGLSLGETKTAMWDTVEATVSFMPWDKPRYLMGVGSPEDIVEGVSKGIDIFDSALPTRVARNGAVYTSQGRKNIKRSVNRDIFQSLDEGCQCFTCRNFTTAYVHHLFKCEELLAYRLATIHNLFFITSLIKNIKTAINEGNFADFKHRFMENYRITDEMQRIEQKRKYFKSEKFLNTKIG